jgi:hypothetical protein
MQLVIPRMREQGGGAILITVSVIRPGIVDTGFGQHGISRARRATSCT